MHLDALEALLPKYTVFNSDPFMVIAGFFFLVTGLVIAITMMDHQMIGTLRYQKTHRIS
jgi:hypothetical protein